MSFNDNPAYKLHLMINNGYVYACKVCGYNYKYKGSLSRHIMERHGEYRTFFFVTNRRLTSSINFKGYLMGSKENIASIINYEYILHTLAKPKKPKARKHTKSNMNNDVMQGDCF